MKKGYLSEYFMAIGYKRLSAVEANRHRSNQHEFDGVTGLKSILGGERCTFPAQFVYLNDEDLEPIADSGFLTWYDARESHPERSEWRLYFPTTRVSECATEGDLLVIGRRPDHTLMVIIAESGSTAENQVLWLFGISDPTARSYSLKAEAESDRVKLEFASRIILEQLGIELEETGEDYLEIMLKAFAGAFPSTAVFSAFARSTVKGLGPKDDPDAAIVAWLEREEILFRTLERHLIGDRLKQGFDADVDAFISFSLSVQNRRKSRAGFALENHLQCIFREHELRYARTPFTEGRASPDFLFPGDEEYHTAQFPAVLLTMLGVKSSCKERWRQVLAEADRIDDKHLLTLEPGISERQTSEMRGRRLQLVIPKGVHRTYTANQQAWIMDLQSFIALVADRQSRIP